MKLLKEDRGVSRITALYSNIIFDAITDYADDLIDRGVKKKKIIVIDAKTIQDNIVGYEDDFLDFPVQKITVELKFSNGEVPKSHPQGFDTGGAMYPFSLKKHDMSFITKKYDVNFSKTILDELTSICELRMDLSILIDDNKFKPNEFPNLKLELMSVIIHEMNHGYEFWMRYNNKVDSDLKYSLASLKIEKTEYTKKVYNHINKFLYYLYWSLPYEQNAKVQELYPFVLKKDVNELTKMYQFKNIKSMIDFKGNDYYNELLTLIPERQLNKVLKKMLISFITTYKKTHKKMDEVMDDNIINKLSIRDIFKYYEKTINHAGENMRKKILRLYSIKKDLNGSVH